MEIQVVALGFSCIEKIRPIQTLCAPRFCFYVDWCLCQEEMPGSRCQISILPPLWIDHPISPHEPRTPKCYALCGSATRAGLKPQIKMFVPRVLALPFSSYATFTLKSACSSTQGSTRGNGGGLPAHPQTCPPFCFFIPSSSAPDASRSPSLFSGSSGSP
uniref:Uncharacterized protein n=1 Tax=Pseudictyota dubia TaxID=2749911 RepID=A0A7R9W535_9STRA|mmetsp:Transcript_32224/g.59262  ORF Transcript_32224/g.59262 Transcript_32224/m.59262 type:complete len:160 (+) Transcript_32224:229-708(+)